MAVRKKRTPKIHPRIQRSVIFREADDVSCADMGVGGNGIEYRIRIAI